MAAVIVVDDEESLRESFALFLSRDGHSVATAADGRAALALLAQRSCDVVVTDVLMPDMSGVELLGHLVTAASTVKVILVTGEPSLETAAAAIRSRACDYLAKPVSGAALCRSVAHAAQAKALEDENRLYRERLETLVEERTSGIRASEERPRVALFQTRESEERYRRLLAAVTDYIYAASVEDGRVVATRHGPGRAAVTGYTSEDLEADPYLWFRMVTPEDRAQVEEHARRILAGQEVGPLEHRIVTKGGE